jgi:molybdenum cofactor guanylyltransferase
MLEYPEVGGFVLAGGASLRMGRDKALLELGGVAMIVRAVRLLEQLVDSPVVIASPSRFDGLGLRVVADDEPGLGPLGGIATALRVSAHSWNLIVACDLPYLTTEWLSFLIQRAAKSPVDAVLPQSGSGVEPLCAMYHKRALPAVTSALAHGVRKITDGIAGLAILSLAPSESKAFDSGGLLFKNINTREEYEAARAAFSRKAGK